MMNKIVAILLISFAANGFSALSIDQTAFRKAPLAAVVQSAEQGDPEAQLELAFRYYAGHQVPKDASTAFLWMRKSAEQKHPVALERLSQMVAEGIGVAADSQQAEEWFIAALVVNPKSSTLENQFNQRVKEQKETHGNADDFLKKCAEAGYAPAVMASGQPQAASVESNGLHEAADAEYQAAELEFSAALAAEHSDQEGYAQHLKRAVRGYKSAADQQHPEAQYMLGRLYASGDGVSKNNKRAFQYYELAAAQGHTESLFYLGLMHHAGLGVPRDISKAISLYEAAAESGNKGALFYLGNCYRFGEGIPQDLEKGEEIYSGKILNNVQPAEKEQVDAWAAAAAREYGILLGQQADSQADFATAANWVGIAASNGDDLSRGVLLKMNERNQRSSRDRSPIVFEENKVDPATDAVQRRRIPAFFPYMQFPLKELYAKSEVDQRIVSVELSSGRFKNIAGDELSGLFMRYLRPSRFRAVGFSGIVLIGIELTDSKTGERYWSLGEYIDDIPACSWVSFTDLFVSVDKTFCPDAKLTGWAVVYGHLLSDGRTVAVIDTREFKTTGLLELSAQNRYSEVLECNIISCNDTWSIMDPTLQEIDKESFEELESDIGVLRGLINIFTPDN